MGFNSAFKGLKCVLIFFSYLHLGLSSGLFPFRFSDQQCILIFSSPVHPPSLTLNPLNWKIWLASNNASRWQMGFNSAFEELIYLLYLVYMKPIKRQVKYAYY